MITSRISLETLENLVSQASTDTIELSLASDHKSIAEVDQVIGRAFHNYALFVWALDKLDKNLFPQGILFLSQMFQNMCTSTGFIIQAKDKKNGKVVGACEVSYEKPSTWKFLRFFQELYYFFIPLIKSILFGKIGLPWFLFKCPPQLRSLIFKRMRAIDQLTDERRKVMGLREHLYLAILATDPEIQSGGVGTALMKGVEKVAEHLGIPTYLETDTERLRNYYTKNGFRLTCQYVVHDDIQPFEPNFGLLKEPIVMSKDSQKSDRNRSEQTPIAIGSRALL